MNGFQRCYCRNGDACCFKADKVCTILSDTAFKSGVCPFKKTIAELNEGRERSIQRLIHIGKPELISYYNEH